jgi:pimeloyl-ACP methyl ester carboxylesterase
MSFTQDDQMFIPAADAHLHVVAFGPGPRTLLAFGGWAGSWQLWAGPFGPLSRTWRAVAYDHIHGDADALVPVEDARWLAGQMPHAELHILPGAGHVPTMTRPAEVAAIIDRAFTPLR